MNLLTQFINNKFQEFRSKQLGRFVRTPTVLQMENTECAAASLSIILQYYGRYIPLTQLRELCGVSRDGSDAANLVLAAQSLGLEAKGFKKGLSALRQIKPPAILFWEFNHFLVFEGFIGDKVAINDPALGPRTISKEEFDISYTGIVITINPGPNFERGGSAPSVWPVVLNRLLCEPKGVTFLIICGIILILPQLVMPIYAQIYIDEVIGNNMQNWLKPMLLAMALTIGIQVVLQNLQLVATRSLEKRLTRRFSIEFEHQVLSLPARFYSQRHASDIATRMENNAEIAEFIGGQLIPTFTGIILLGFYLILTFLYSYWLGLLILLTTGFNALVVQINLRLQRDANLQLQKDSAQCDAVVVSAVQDIETIKSAAIEQDIYRRFAGFKTRLLNNIQELQLLNARIKVAHNSLTTLNEVAILLLGFWLVIQGELTLGMLLAAQTIAFSLKGEIEKIIEFIQDLPSFEAGVLRLQDIVEQPRDPLLINDSRGKLDSSIERKLSGHIELKDISFGFTQIQEPLIESLNLVIQAGERVAIVGMSGSGKSTIAKIISGLYQPTSGELLIDGIPLVDIPRNIVSCSLAMVEQEIQLFGCSVRDNLTLWDKSIKHVDLVQACEDAALLDIVLSLSEGFETQLDEDGNNLSGGQRQRLELARALCRNPSILILDEATSALDAETEWRVIEQLRQRGCTQIIVAHRLSTIRDADTILVMQNGEIIQKGTHESLVKDSENVYAQLINEIA